MIIKTAVRAGIVVGAVYYTRHLGVWGEAVESEKLCGEIKSELRPHVQKLSKQLPFEVPALPKRGEISYLATHYYNNGVKSSFHFIKMIPCYAGQFAQKAVKTFNEFSQSPATPGPTATIDKK